jgi:hypothetical protein
VLNYGAREKVVPLITENRLTKILFYGATTLAILAAAILILVPSARVSVARTLLPGVCMTENLKTIADLGGMKFDVVYTNCDTLIKEDSVSVYISKTLNGRESLFARWSNRRILIFRYVPGRSDTPSISSIGGDRILISIPDVSSVYFQSHEWENIHIDYNIGRIYYP